MQVLLALPFSKHPQPKDGEHKQEDSYDSHEAQEQPHKLEHSVQDLLHSFPVST